MAANGPDSTGTIGVRIASFMGLAGLELPDPLTSKAKRSIVGGHVLGPNGEPVTQARVSIVGDSAVMVTDSTGRFTLNGIRSGTRMLSVRRLGFEPVEKPIIIHTGEPTDFTVRLTRVVAVLDTVRITARRELDLTRVGFTQRKRTGTGYYMGPEQIERAGAYDLVSLLGMAPMLRRQTTTASRLLLDAIRERAAAASGITSMATSGLAVTSKISFAPMRFRQSKPIRARFAPPQFSARNDIVRDCPHMDQAESSLMIRSCLAFTVATAFSAFCSHLAHSQTPASAPTSGTIEGIAIDSLHQDFLRGATLTVEGAESRAVTDSLGRFKLENVPPGMRRVEVLHPLLDTIGVTLLTAPLQIAAGQQVRLIVSTPSVETVLARKCTVEERAIGPVALIGTVEYAETERPAVGARVVLEWIEHRVTGKNIQMLPRERSAVIGQDGRYKLCGLPEDVSGTLTAVSGADSTSSVEVHLTGPIGVMGLELPERVALRQVLRHLLHPERR
jgi:hypothetical protein